MGSQRIERKNRLGDRAHSLIAMALLVFANEGHAEGLVESLVLRFSQSDFEFLRARSNVPFLPVAWVSATEYEASQLNPTNDALPTLSSQQSAVSQGAFVPIALGQRDILVVGEWLSWTQFDLDPGEELEVVSASVPIGWIQQSSPDWQIAAFVAPLGHKTHGEGWYWETLGGVFARNMHRDRFAWIIGAYFDVSPLEDFYIPYLGATYIFNERWTLNAVMPWPAIMYAPTADTLLRLGVAPSGSSWSIEPGEKHPRMDLSSWDFGFSIEHRVAQHVWVALEVGVSAIRGLSIVGGEWEQPETKLSNTGFARLTINLRPGVALDHSISRH